jgi:hypothetical protein
MMRLCRSQACGTARRLAIIQLLKATSHKPHAWVRSPQGNDRFGVTADAHPSAVRGAPCLPFTAALSDGANGAAIALQYARIKHVISSLPMDGVAGNGNTVTFTVVPAAARRGV